MEENILDHSEKETGIEFSSKSASFSTLKGVIGIIVCVALVAFYFWASSNMIAFSSGHDNSVIQGYLIYGTLLLSYSVLSIIIGSKLKLNDQRACLRLELVKTIVQLFIAVLLVLDWWHGFETNVL